jgi:hypothetical protein
MLVIEPAGCIALEQEVFVDEFFHCFAGDN